MKITFFILLSFLFGCKVSIKYPDGGFEYPKSVKGNDTNNYYYAIRHIETKRDLFWDSYSYLIFKPFNEPNLSLRPLPSKTFRLYYSTAFGEITIITLTSDSLTIKQGNPFDLYDTDTSRLTQIENYHLNLLRKWYPIDTVGKHPMQKSYFDSLLQLYPQLNDPNYYHRIYDQSLIRKDIEFKYESSMVTLSKAQYDSLIQDINSSGFWSYPHLQKCNEDIADGYLYQLEANTTYKYQVVNMQGCPNDTSKFTKACQRIVNLAKLEKKINLIWKETVDTSGQHLDKE